MKTIYLKSTVSALFFLGMLAGCEKPFAIVKDVNLPQVAAGPTPSSPICVENPNAAACSGIPMVTTPGIVTILFTMHEIPQDSGSLIVANAIRYASPVVNPKILYLMDSNTHGEDDDDIDYIKNSFLKGFNLTYSVIPAGGLAASAVDGYDLVIVSNPGFPLTDQQTFNTLMAYKGGVILFGDDISQGVGFSMTPLTGLNFVSNGTDMSCNGQTYRYEYEQYYYYQVSIETSFFPGIPAQYVHYEYGDDLDQTTAVSGTQVLAWASAAPGTCDIGKVPAIVRRPR